MGQVFRRAEQYLDQFDIDYVGQFVEIGTSRNGDDGSTKTIAEWAQRFKKPLWTVDMDPVNCEFVSSLNIANIEVVNSTGEKYLQEFPGHIGYISFLYLDNFDWDWHPDRTEDFVREQQQRYQLLGLEMNNVNSQCAHLAQMTLALPLMDKKSIVICDDTWYNKWWGHYTGKSGAVVPLLLNNGYKILYTEEQPVYGTILGRGIN
jgi:hypothetical protein